MRSRTQPSMDSTCVRLCACRRCCSRNLPCLTWIVCFILSFHIFSLQCQFLLTFQRLPTTWINQPAFGIGLVLAITGMIINAQTDAALRRLRAQGKGGYQIPRGYWLFQYVSCPHYFGEILQWLGFWLAADQSTVAASFVAFTAANLVPRAVHQHAWYRKHFGDAYPSTRKAWIPFVLKGVDRTSPKPN